MQRAIQQLHVEQFRHGGHQPGRQLRSGLRGGVAAAAALQWLAQQRSNGVGQALTDTRGGPI